MPYCEILSYRFLHIDLTSSVCTSKPLAIVFHSITIHWLINSKDENFFRYHCKYRTGYLTNSYDHEELGHMKSIHLKIKELLLEIINTVSGPLTGLKIDAK